MMFKRWIKFIFVLLVLVLTSFPLWLPACVNAIYTFYFESHYSNIKFKVETIGLNSVILSNLKVKHGFYEFKIQRVLVDVNWWNLLKDHRVEKVTVLKLRLEEHKKNQTKEPSETRESYQKPVDIGPNKRSLHFPILVSEFIFMDTEIKYSSKGVFRIPEIQGEITDQRVVFDLGLPLLNQELEFIVSCRYLEFDFPFEMTVLVKAGFNQSSKQLLEITGDLNQVHMESGLFEEPLLLEWKKEQTLNLKLDLDQFNSKEVQLVNFDLDLIKGHDLTWELKTEGDVANFGDIKMKSFRLLFPLQNSIKKGYLSGQLMEKTMGDIDFDFEIKHINNKLIVHGNYHLPKLSLMECPFEMKFDYSKKQMFPEFSVNSNFDNKELSIFTEEFQLMEGHLSASVNAAVQLSYKPSSGWSESLSFSAHHGFFATNDFSMTMSGIEMALSSDQIFSMNTGPSQSFKWKSFKSQGMEFIDGKVFWQWERQQKLFVESLKMGWCGGALSLLPIRLDEARNDFDFTFFCERVQLAEVLKTFQVGEVEGEGELGGKISFAFQNGKWRFEDTYLYSDPAKEGRLMIKEAQMLDQAMDQSQLQLARESLKDYRYKWAKVNFVSEKDNLLLKLVMDGKPNGLLPFRFDPKTAQFIYDKESPGVDLKGLKLNTNFRSEQFMPLLERSLNFLKKIELE